jgi:D-alanyl-D-alanine carboxypeptidase/D-alanyl-D-alanine-endopeptidase (penicillin-binding protein 4)
MMKQKFFWLPLLLLATSATCAQTILPESVSAILRNAGLAEASLSALVLPIQGGAPRLAILEERAMAPASTMKLATTLVALEELGPTFRWRTELLSQGRIDAATLRGTLYLRGGGEPNLSWDGMRAMFRSLRAQGVAHLEANLVLDRSLFQPIRPDIGAPDFDESPKAYYNVIPDALVLNGNVIEFSLESNGQKTLVRTQPPLAGVLIDADLSLKDVPCDAWDDDWDAPLVQASSDDTVTVVLRGAFPRNCKTKTRLSLLDRNLYIERFLQAYWQELGGTWKGRVKDGLTPPDAVLLVERNSDTLADLVKPINKASDNLMARTLYLTVGTQLPKEGRKDNSFVNADATMRSWFSKNDIATTGLVFENGSGLSRLERISARQLASLLQIGARSNWYAEFASSFPIVAIDGAMRRRLRESPAAGRARIKTGTLRDAVAVAGYVRDVRNQDWVVVAFINDPEARKGRPALDALIDWVASGR